MTQVDEPVANEDDIGAVPDEDVDTASIVHNEMLTNDVYVHAVPLTDYAGFIVKSGNSPVSSVLTSGSKLRRRRTFSSRNLYPGPVQGG